MVIPTWHEGSITPQNIAFKFLLKKLHRFSLDTKAEQYSTVLIKKDKIDMLRDQIFLVLGSGVWSIAVILLFLM